MFQKAIRTTEEVKININAEIDLGIDLSLSIKINSDNISHRCITYNTINKYFSFKEN